MAQCLTVRLLQTGLDSQTLTAFGAASVDDSAAATGFHANQKAVGTCAAGLGGLVSAFHGSILKIAQSK
jgi:hypothetical protein